VRIVHTDLEIQRESFARPFGFKGSSFHEKWNLVVRLRDENGTEAYGLGGLAALWSDPSVFEVHTEVGGNLLMASLLEFALQQVKGRDIPDPTSLLTELLPPVHDYGKTVTRNPDLRLTFSLNALVALDNAAWVLYARRNGMVTFDDLIPEACRPHLAYRQRHLAIVPTVGYHLPDEELWSLLRAGVAILKIKIGHAGDEPDMVRADIARLTAIHRAARACETPMTDSGNVLYYLDANGRYSRKEGLARLLDHAHRIGALDRIVLVEEPFAESLEIDVSDFPARLAADESLQTVRDVQNRVDQGYRAVAVKPAGKTLSLAFQMVQAADEAGVPCFVADNACVPILVEWNKNVAARLPDFPGVRGGLVESNGPETYADWPRLLTSYPIPDAPWLMPRSGAFVLGDDYYRSSGGIFLNPTPYSGLFRS
jgi:L-alanine-DL-glutamate epimerase-like enolase superfamily enzyme